MPPFPGPIATSGKVILVATIKAKDGKADQVHDLLKACRKAAESDEKGTLTYRTTRGEGDRSNVFLVFEEYLLPDGLEDHASNAPFQALAKADVIADLDIKYYHEYQ